MTTATSTAQSLDEASQAISDVTHNFNTASNRASRLELRPDDIWPGDLADLIMHLETVQAGIAKALAAAKTAQAQLG